MLRSGPSGRLLAAALAPAACKGPDGPGRTMKVRLSPLYSAASNENGDSYGTTAFFHWYRNDQTPKESYTHIIPFYFHSENDRGDWFLLIPPFYYGNLAFLEEDRFFLVWGTKQRGPRIDTFALFPLIRFTRFEDDPDRSGFFCFLIADYWRDGDRKQVKLLDLLGLAGLLDLEWGIPTQEGDQGHAFSFFEVLKMVRLAGGRNAGGFDDFELLTLFSNEKWSLFQRHWRKDGASDGRTVLFPVYWHFRDEEKETVHLWPLVGWDNSEDGAYARHLFYPFFTFEGHASRDRFAVDCPWPLVRFMRDDSGAYENRLLPFYWSGDKDGRRFFMLAPFYGKYASGEGYERRFYTPFVSPYEDPEAGGGGIDILYPLISHQRYEDSAHERFIPLYWFDFEGDKRFMEITPLFWDYRDGKGYAFDLFFPFYAYFGYGEEDSTYSLIPLFKLIADRPKEESPGRFKVDRLWPLAGYGRKETRSIAWLFPLFKHINDDSLEMIEWGFLADILDFKVEKSRKTFTFFWFLPVSWGGRETPESEE